MGLGEEYLGDWYLWVQGLSAQRMIAYKTQYPEPEEWEGTYASILALEGKVQENSWDEYWNEIFERQKKIIDAQLQIAQRHEQK
jgi:hypothetical protein